jgi:formylglycine-generating enzyme required for sulfatase activity
MRSTLCLVAIAPFCLALPQAWAQQTPETVTIEAGVHVYLPAGEFISSGKSIASAPQPVLFRQPLVIMKYQVDAGDYAKCVMANACDNPFRSRDNGPGKPVTGVSFKDATDYANWLSRETGQAWRLPTDAEWSFAAGSRFAGDVMEPAGESADPSTKWIANYRRMALEAATADPQVYERSTFGANEHGLHDLSGNVWEWTSSCYQRVRVDDEGGNNAAAENCGVRVVEGRHRTYMTYFVQDAASGGCAIGSAPDHLGFRLVREEATFRDLVTWTWERLTN